MKNLVVLTILISSVLLINSQNIVSANNALEKCGAESVLVAVTKMLNSFYHDKTNISALLSDSREIYTSMNIEQFSCLAKYFAEEKFSFHSKLSDFGFLLLETSNCLKDVGPVFILLDNVITSIQHQPRDWQDIIMSTVFTGLLSYQSYNDCKVIYDGVISLLRNSK